VLLRTADPYVVLGGETVTNTGPSVLNGSLGVSPGSAVVGFPPGLVVAPGVIDAANPVAAQAQADLTAAYLDAEARPIDAMTVADLGNQTLNAGVWATTDHGPLSLTGPLVLDGEGNADSVFIFQTDSTLITGSGSTVTLINGAQGCNVFWQVGSSATLGTGSVFAGNILALTSITVTSGVTVHGRALARNGAVTLDNDVFDAPSCAGTTTGSSITATSVSDTVPGAGTTVPGGGDTTVPGAGDTTPSTVSADTAAPTTVGPSVFEITLPRTGSQQVGPTLVPAFIIAGLGVLALGLARRRVSQPD
jgi:hypothetical protein